ncbi:MAG TPA: EspA/EspE family type VII secretion system effector [Mycobacterium sp.]|nr:EspA/EspE family type VII secretion system effector [Mycobacterium sp.]
MKLVGELIEGIAGPAGLSNVRAVGESLKSGRHSVDEAVGSDLLDVGQSVIAGMKSTTGEGLPDTGARFSHGHSGFNRAGQTLQSAGPDDSWDGPGSRAYADQNTRQQMRTETIADADREVHRVLYREAAQITLRRGYLDDQSHFLANANYVSFPLQFIPQYGAAAKLTMEMAALQAALGESAHQMYELQSEVATNATELQQAIGRYCGVADGADLPAAGLDLAPPVPLDVDIESDHLQAPVTVTLERDVSPGPPAGTSPQDKQ